MDGGWHGRPRHKGIKTRLRGGTMSKRYLDAVRSICFGLFFVVLLTPLRSAADAARTGHADKVSTWQGFERRDFKIDGRDCTLIVPAVRRPREIRGSGAPSCSAMNLRQTSPCSPRASTSPTWTCRISMKRPVALDHMDKFYDHLTHDRGLATKTVLEGFSRGGLFTLNWAARHPDRVACIYNDAPVCDFKSWPAGKGKSKGSAEDWQPV